MDLLQLEEDLERSDLSSAVQRVEEIIQRIKTGHEVDESLLSSILSAWKLTTDHPSSTSDPVLLKKLMFFLRFACTQGSSVQTKILSHEHTLDNIRMAVSHPDETVNRSAWQLCSNLLVQCPENVEMRFRDLLPLSLAALQDATKYPDMIAAVVHNLLEANKLLVPPVELNKVEIYQSSLSAISKFPEEQFTFLQFLMEDLMITEKEPKDPYFAMDSVNRIKLHRYVTEYVKSDVQELSSAFLRVLSENFNRLSDNILTWLNGQVASVDPQELLSLLESLCTITGNPKYSLAYKSEASMFINSGALLVACCDSQKSELSPKGKLTDFDEALKETIDPFYDFKTLLIRLIGNLAYKNKKNQDYARDLKILFTVCGCTTLDARNPLMKEWSILAIRNLLDNNLENQKLIHQLTQQGRVGSDVVKEFQPENGFLRLEK